MNKLSILGLMILVCLSASTFAQTITGNASFYNEFYNGRLTTTEEVYDSGLMTAASQRYDLGTYLKVTNTDNGKAIIVRMNDRCHCENLGRMIDLSRKAAGDLDILRSGHGNVSIEPVPTWQQEQLTRDFLAQNGSKYPKLIQRIENKTTGYYLSASNSNERPSSSEGMWKKFSVRKWGVQVSALTDTENVNGVKEALVKQLNVARDDIYVIVSQRNGKPLYRVVVGKYDSIDDARAAEKQMSDKGYPGIIQEHI